MLRKVPGSFEQGEKLPTLHSRRKDRQFSKLENACVDMVDLWKEKKRKREDGDEGIPMTELEKIVFLESKRNEMESGTRVHGFFSKTLNELLDKYDPSPSGSSPDPDF